MASRWTTHVHGRVVLITGDSIPIEALEPLVALAAQFCQHPDPLIYYGIDYQAAAVAVAGTKVIMAFGPPNLTLDEFKSELSK